MCLAARDLMILMDELAPPHLAEEWDRCGLQAGSPSWPVTHVRAALDPSPGVIERAVRDGVQMLITHHPLLLKPLTVVNPDSGVSALVCRALEHRMVIFSAHTNLDSVRGGINDLLADLIGLETTGRSALTPPPSPALCKFIVFVPPSHEQEILSALFENGAGRIGDYDACSFRMAGTGTFRPGGASTPYSGAIGEIAHESELRIEALVRAVDLARTVAAVKAAHPYEVMAWDAYPLHEGETGRPLEGLGRVGRLMEPLTLGELAGNLKQVLCAPGLRAVGNPDHVVVRAAICSGSGGSLLPSFFSSDADVYLTGDIKYHEAMTVLDNGRCLIDAGHFPTERIMMPTLMERLGNRIRDRFPEAADKLILDVCPEERDPFRLV